MSDPSPRLPPGPHPSPEELYRARRGPRDAAADRVLAHAVACAACSEELLRQEAFDRPRPLSAARLESEWERFARGEPAAGARASRRRRFAGRPLFALAATVAAVAVGLAAWLAIGPGPGPGGPQPGRPGAGSPPPQGSLRGGRPEAQGFAPTGTLGTPPAEFLFPAAGSVPRRVLVFDAGGSYRWTSEPATGGRASFPESERQKLRPGVEYFWTVLDGGAGAPSLTFRIAPR